MAAAAHPTVLGVTVLVVVLLHSISVATQPLFPAMFIFGDSLVDSGNNNYISLSLAKADILPNGIDFPTGTATGRFCNGRTSFDILSDHIGLPYPPPALAPTSRGLAILRGLNYASGAAGLLNGTGADYVRITELKQPHLEIFQSHVGGPQDSSFDHYSVLHEPLKKFRIDLLTFNEQIAIFQQSVFQMVAILGQSSANDLLHNSLFAVAMGSNDYVNNYLLPSDNSTRTVYTPSQFVELLISTYRTQLTTLYNSGARKFVISNVGPLGCMPSRLALGSLDGTCVAYDNEMAQRFNQELEPLLRELRESLQSSMFLYGNSYDMVYNLIQDPFPEGFNVVNEGCCGAGQFNGQLPCLPVIDSLCTNRSEYVFWDPYHPTEAVNVRLGNRMFNGPLSDISPMNVQQLASLTF